MRHRHRAILLFLSASLPAVAHAQASPAAAEATEKAQRGIEDIVVTAQKRSENVQDIPLAITAVSGDMLQDRQVTSVDQLSSVAPGVRSEEHTSELQSLMRNSNAVFCLKNKNINTHT